MNVTAHPVVLSLTPVILLVGAGWLAGRLQWIRREALKDLSNLVFLLLIPSLLFRTMSNVRLNELDLRPLGAYFVAALTLLAASIAWRGLTVRSVVMALGGVFSNMVMIGITLIDLAYGRQGMVTLLTLVSVHALILLTVSSLTLELFAARELPHGHDGPTKVWGATWSALKGAVLHPIPLPILCGLLFAQTGWTLPSVVDKPLQLLGNAFGPLSLVLVGVSLAATPMSGHWRDALRISVVKNLVLPLLVGLSAWAFGITGLPFTVMVLAAGLPIGANVFLFAQRYKVVQELTTASMGVSTVLALFSLTLLMLVLPWWSPQ